MTTSCGIIILAAGGSSRMGRPKQFLLYQGHSLLENCIQAALKVNVRYIVLVTGAYAEKIKATTTAFPVHIAENIHWKTGIASSICCGILAMLKLQPNINQVIITTADQPFLTSTILQKMMEVSEEPTAEIVACQYADTIGTPALFHQKYFQELLQLTGDEGAKKLLKIYQDKVRTVFFPLGNIDIDTMEDYENLMAK